MYQFVPDFRARPTMKMYDLNPISKKNAYWAGSGSATQIWLGQSWWGRSFLSKQIFFLSWFTWLDVQITFNKKENIVILIYVDPNCTCAGVENNWGDGSECKFYTGYKNELLNSVWCYAETTTCSDATTVKYKPNLYVNEGRFGPSQSACAKIGNVN